MARRVATPAYHREMSPNAPKTPARQFRVGDDWLAFEKAATAMGSERAAVLRAFIEWYLHKPGSRMPKRPERAEWDTGEQDTATTENA